MIGLTRWSVRTSRWNAAAEKKLNLIKSRIFSPFITMAVVFSGSLITSRH